MGLNASYVESQTVQKCKGTLTAFCLVTSTVLSNFWRLVSVHQLKDTSRAKKALEITPAEEFSKLWNCMDSPKSEISQWQPQRKFLQLFAIACPRWGQGAPNPAAGLLRSPRCSQPVPEAVPTSWAGSAAHPWLTRAAAATFCTPRERRELASSFFSSVLIH